MIQGAAQEGGVGTGWISVTPRVDWTVRAVIAEVPKRRWAAKVWRSAVMPAPLEGSWPAMVRRVRVEALEIDEF